MNRNRTHSARTYSPALLSGAMVFSALVVAGISGCGDSSATAKVYASHESSAGAPIHEVTYNTSGSSCAASAVTLAPLTGKAVRDLEVVDVSISGGGTERRYYALVASPDANGNLLLVIRGSDQAVLASIPIQSQSQALAISTDNKLGYVIRTGGGPVYRVNLLTNAVDLTATPLDGGLPALAAPTDVAVRKNKNGQDEVWIGDGGISGVVILNQNLGFLGKLVLTGATSPRVAFSRDQKVLFAASQSASSSLWAIDGTSFDTTSSAPAVLRSISGFTNVGGIGAANGMHVQLVSLNAGSGQYELQDYDFAYVNPVPTRQVLGSYTQRPWSLRYATQTNGTFVTERNLGRVACQSGNATTASTPVALAEVVSFSAPAPPAPVSITIQTSPANLPLEVDGQIYNTTQTFPMIPGTEHAVRAPAATAAVAGTRQGFGAWSDGVSSAMRSFTVPSTSATLTAVYLTQHLLTLNVGANGTASASPAAPGGDGFYNAGTPVTITAVPNLGLTTSFTGTDSATGNTGTVTMNAPRTVGVTFGSAAPSTFSYSTSGVFLCTAGPIPGCGTNTVTIGNLVLTFTGVGSSGNAPTIVQAGELQVSCQGGGTGCGNTGLPSGFGLRITLNQTAPSAGSGTFTATVFGSMSGTASAASMFFVPSQPLIPRPGGNVQYLMANNPIALVPPSVNAGVVSLPITVSFQ